jgi:hypothetical protein
MIGFNGGLIGGLATARNTSLQNAVGVWTLNEQRRAKLTNQWPVVGGLLLDDYSGAAVAYSLRSLTSVGVSNPVVRVRRSSGSPSEADFTATEVSDGTLTGWVGAGNNGFAVTWYDQSGNSNNATQSDTAKQPRIVTSGTLETESSNPALLWQNSDVNLNFATRLTTVRSYFLLAKLTTTANVTFLLGDSTLFDFHGGSANSTWLNNFDAALVVRNGDNRLNGVTTSFTATNKSTTRYIFTMITTGNAAASQLTQDRNQGSRSWVGPIQEVIIYTSDQASNRAGIETNINAHYSVF